jgi:hypothetical protein
VRGFRALFLGTLPNPEPDRPKRTQNASDIATHSIFLDRQFSGTLFPMREYLNSSPALAFIFVGLMIYVMLSRIEK